MNKVQVILFIILFVLLLECVEGNIHRAAHTRRGPKQETEFFARIKAKIYKSWYAIPAAIVVGCTGIFPLPLMSMGGISEQRLKQLLGFAVGTLLGDVFLHLLPEAWMYVGKDANSHYDHLKVGILCLAGVLFGFIFEKVFEEANKEKDEKDEKVEEVEAKDEKKFIEEEGTSSSLNEGGLRKRNQNVEITNKDVMEEEKPTEKDVKSDEKIAAFGYLNLLANYIDNFTHGLAVAGSFIVSNEVGMCTTLAILLHEIPHEISDFAILLKSGFNIRNAAFYQVVTGFGALIGAIFGLIIEGAGDTTAWVLPFISGEFIYIALVTIVPDLLKETNPRESFKQTIAIMAGIGTMTLVSMFPH